MRESQYTQAIHRHLPKEVYRWKINDNFQGGVPDAYYSGTKADLWVEYKYLQKLPKRETTLIVPNLSTLQLDWLRTREREGRKIVVIIGSPEGGCVLYCSQWESGISLSHFRNEAMSKKELASWITTQTRGN